MYRHLPSDTTYSTRKRGADMNDIYKAFLGYKFMHPDYSDTHISDILSNQDKTVFKELVKLGEAYLECLVNKTTAY